MKIELKDLIEAVYYLCHDGFHQRELTSRHLHTNWLYSLDSVFETQKN